MINVPNSLVFAGFSDIYKWQREKLLKEKAAKSSAGQMKTYAVKRIVNSLLKAEYSPSEAEQDILFAFGYDIEACGLPTAAVMILCSMAARAVRGDAKAAEFLFSHGHIPNMDQFIKLEQLKAYNEATLNPVVFLCRVLLLPLPPLPPSRP